MCPPDGDWQLQVPPGAPGTARQGPTRNIIVFTNDGGIATQPRAPGHGRPRAASSDAAGRDRLRATLRAPGADVPPATTAGAPGQYRLRAALLAPGHERPRAALRAARHGRPRAAPRAPGADVPPASTAGAPGQHCPSAAHLAPGHERPRAALRAARHGRPRAAPRAPGADVPLATTAEAPGQHRLRAMANATVALPASQHRLCQEGLPRVPANPRTLTYPHSHRDTTQNRATHSQRHSRRSRESGNPRPPVATGGPQGGYTPKIRAAYPKLTPTCYPTKCILPSKYRPTRGLAPPRPRASHTTAAAHPRSRPPTLYPFPLGRGAR